ncbi:LytTR family DNA-binding domain-containing protein [Longimicrobium sp.]|uniref:LytR/AlgR family response regulator transcription factor n=1 Tax=Longimicrobium sp. TaxID=2029185 RepID=UPI002E304903|nr:LytTR family DNA-binding domain-containing protein [Longimicrobium sp.]HEX6040655.1 LytTR family DNA-binding domain-containing protein [Longimicrobium sp.]
MTPPVRALVVDDEAIARRGVVRLLGADPDVEVVGEAGDGREAADAVMALAPDLLLLDVQMPRLDGFGCLAALPAASRPVTVFMTAYDAYALRAFDERAVDYLLKPFSDERFYAAVARAKEAVRDRRLRGASDRLLDALLASVASSAPAPTADPLRPADDEATASGPPASGWASRVLVPRGERWTFVGVDDIDWIGAAGSYAEVHAGGATHLLREPLGDLAARLDPRRFVRVHRSTVVNLDRVREIQPWFNGQLVLLLQDGTQVTVSRRRRAALESALGQAL